VIWLLVVVFLLGRRGNHIKNFPGKMIQNTLPLLKGDDEPGEPHIVVGGSLYF
jgi:hypothetical protein